MHQQLQIPKSKKQFTRRDKDAFLKYSLVIVKTHFHKALSQLEFQNPGVKTKFTDVHDHKFMCNICVNHGIKRQCKIWGRSLLNEYSIAYDDSHISLDNDNSYCEQISVEDDGFQLTLNFLSVAMFSEQKFDHLSAQEAAEILWKRFTSELT